MNSCVPFVCTDTDKTRAGQPLATIADDDACICFNFRADRVREITRALCRNSGLNEKGGSDLPGADDLDATHSTRWRAEESEVCLHDAV